MSKINVSIVNVTPALARELLKDNTRNRNIAERTVKAYARDMAAGKWHLNGEAIKRAEDGTLLDGQQRLSAVVEADTAVDMVFVDGLPLEAQDTMDQGRKRTFADQLAIRGEHNVNVLAAVARRVYQWQHGDTRFGTANLPTASELADIIAKYPGLRRSSEVGARTTQNFRATTATVVGTAHHILGDVDQGLAAEFFALFETGANLGEGHPVLALRNRLVRDKMMAKRVPFHLAFALFVRAWNAHVEGRTLDRIVQTVEDKLPPISKPAQG